MNCENNFTISMLHKISSKIVANALDEHTSVTSPKELHATILYLYERRS